MKLSRTLGTNVCVLVLVLAQPSLADRPAANAERNMTGLALSSAAFSAMGEIPRRFTCEGDDVSPDFAWSNVPPGARSFVLIVDDPDAPDPAAPKLTWVHWVLYDIPASVTGVKAGMTSTSLPAGTKEGLNDWRRTGYGGPCPPIGRHRYVHKLYALDAALPGLDRPTKAQVEAAMVGHVLAKAELIGTYRKAK
jgi:Raf kinase inhibitor-like YbhB/YbcL family protein